MLTGSGDKSETHLETLLREQDGYQADSTNLWRQRSKADD